MTTTPAPATPAVSPMAPNLAPGAVLIQSAPAPAASVAPAPAEPVIPAPAPAPAATEAPAAAPVIGDQPAPADGLTAEQSGQVFAYDSTGDVGLDFALDFVGKLGFGPEHPAMVAAGTGDFALLEAALAALGDKAQGYDKFVALAKESLTKANGAASEAAAKTRSACAAVAGGEAELDAVIAWASKQAADGIMLPEEKESLNAMLAAGGLQAVAATKMLMEVYSTASNTVQTPAPTTPAPAANAALEAGETLTKRSFADASRQLRQKHGPNFQSTPEYKALAARALAQR